MKLFWKIFSTVFSSFIIGIFAISYFISIRQISDIEKHTLEDYKVICKLISKGLEIGYAKSEWPFESLKILSERKDLNFWWVVRDDGVIHLANDTSFMGTSAYSYFPQITNIKGEERVILNRNQNYGIFIRAFEAGKNKWLFWLGFSLRNILEMKRKIILVDTIVSIFALLLLGVWLYFMIKFFTKPIKELAIGTQAIGKGDLSYRVKVESQDELGQLAVSFNKMVEDLRKITVSHDELAKEITERKKAEEKLQQQNEFLNIILESLTYPFYVIDANDYSIKIANSAARINSAGPISTCYAISHKRDKPCSDEYLCPLEEVKKTKKAVIIEHIHYTKEGNLRNYEIHGYPIFDSEGNVIEMIEYCLDITERKKLEEELKKKMKNLERFNRVAVGRELKMMELKKRIKELEARAENKNITNPQEQGGDTGNS